MLGVACKMDRLKLETLLNLCLVADKTKEKKRIRIFLLFLFSCFMFSIPLILEKSKKNY